MLFRIRPTILFSLLLLCFPQFLLAQSRTPPPTTAAGSIRGAVLLPTGNFLNESVKVTLQSIRGVRSTVYTDNRGQFQFGGLSGGLYQILVEPDGNKFEPATASVEVYPGGPAVLNITLKEKTTAVKSRDTDAVSATELAAVPAKARKEFDHASEASRNGKLSDAIAHLRKAIEIYPGYLMARNDLGVALFSQGKLDEAVEELDRAIVLDSKAFNPHLNLGMVLVVQQKFAQATEQLRSAVALNSNSPSARLYLGIALAGLKELDEAEKQLTAAHDLGGSKYALALFHLGEIHLDKGDTEKARQFFEAYLNESPTAPDADKVRKLISMLPR